MLSFQRRWAACQTLPLGFVQFPDSSGHALCGPASRGIPLILLLFVDFCEQGSRRRLTTTRRYPSDHCRSATAALFQVFILLGVANSICLEVFPVIFGLKQSGRLVSLCAPLVFFLPCIEIYEVHRSELG